jgi:hypothetical protein
MSGAERAKQRFLESQQGNSTSEGFEPIPDYTLRDRLEDRVDAVKNSGFMKRTGKFLNKAAVNVFGYGGLLFVGNVAYAGITGETAPPEHQLFMMIGAKPIADYVSSIVQHKKKDENANFFKLSGNYLRNEFLGDTAETVLIGLFANHSLNLIGYEGGINNIQPALENSFKSAGVGATLSVIAESISFYVVPAFGNICEVTGKAFNGVGKALKKYDSNITQKRIDY